MKKIFRYVYTVTGELLTRREALEIWRIEYDGDDDTNSAEMSEFFEEIEPICAEI